VERRRTKQERNTGNPAEQRGTINDLSLQPRTSAGGGDVVRIQTEFATRVRFMVISLAKRQAREAVKRKLRAEGTRVTLLTVSEINTLADAHLRANAAELLAQAERSGIVQSLWAAESVRKDRRNRTLARQAERNQKEIQQ
jgi:hypothetical protein